MIKYIENELLLNRIIEHVGELESYYSWDDLVECEDYDWYDIEKKVQIIFPQIIKLILDNKEKLYESID